MENSKEVQIISSRQGNYFSVEGEELVECEDLKGLLQGRGIAFGLHAFFRVKPDQDEGFWNSIIGYAPCGKKQLFDWLDELSEGPFSPEFGGRLHIMNRHQSIDSFDIIKLFKRIRTPFQVVSEERARDQSP